MRRWHSSWAGVGRVAGEASAPPAAAARVVLPGLGGVAHVFFLVLFLSYFEIPAACSAAAWRAQRSLPLRAIVDGLRDSISQFSEGVQGSRPKDVIDLLLLTQYFDMLKDVGAQAGTRAVFLPKKGASQVGHVRDGLLQATAGSRNLA